MRSWGPSGPTFPDFPLGVSLQRSVTSVSSGFVGGVSHSHMPVDLQEGTCRKGLLHVPPGGRVPTVQRKGGRASRWTAWVLWVCQGFPGKQQEDKWKTTGKMQAEGVLSPPSREERTQGPKSRHPAHHPGPWPEAKCVYTGRWQEGPHCCLAGNCAAGRCQWQSVQFPVARGQPASPANWPRSKSQLDLGCDPISDIRGLDLLELSAGLFLASALVGERKD